MNTIAVANHLGALAIKKELEAADPRLLAAERRYLLHIADQYRIARSEVLAAIDTSKMTADGETQVKTLRGINHAISQLLPSLQK